MACAECRSLNVETSRLKGMLETSRCRDCGWEGVVHVHDPAFDRTMEEAMRNGPPRVSMTGRWRGRPLKEQAEQLRELLVPEKKLPVTRIMRAGFDGTPIDFGPYLRTEAEAVAEVLDALGMDAALEDITF